MLRVVLHHVMNRLATQQDACGTHVVSHVYHEHRKVSGSPQYSGEHHPPADLHDQHRGGHGALPREARHDLPEAHEYEHQRHELEQSRPIPEPYVRLQVTVTNSHYDEMVFRALILLHIRLLAGSRWKRPFALHPELSA